MHRAYGLLRGFMTNTHGTRGGATLVLASIVMMLAVAIALPAQTFTKLHNFGDQAGAYPEAALVQATDGNFYGTTVVDNIFKMTPSGTTTSLYSFCSQNGCVDGYWPYGGLIQATDGNFYGTTVQGGGNGLCFSNFVGCGTVFKITASGTLTTLYTFCPQGGDYCPDGAHPYAGLVQASDGNFYGTTYVGGTNGGYGTVFKITPSGTLTTLYSFDGWDGEFPYEALIQGTDGNLYGTTEAGGTNNGLYGTVFTMTLGGTLTMLHSFCSQSGCPDGAHPYAGLVQGTDGSFYGTTDGGGGISGYGTVFKITSGGALTTLHVFEYTDGAEPQAGLVQATDGNFYGTTVIAGANGGGTIFKITPSGALTTLYNFCSQYGCADGEFPDAGLIQAADGNLYGTAEYGGGGLGTAFRLSLGSAVGLAPGMLNFDPQGVEGPNTPQVVTLTNIGGAPLAITSITITGQNSSDFAQWNNCPMSLNTLAPGDHCQITVVFSPNEAGTLSADVSITDNAPDSPQMVPLTGIGVGGKVRLR